MAREEKTYRVYATQPAYVYADVQATSEPMARIEAIRRRQWRPSSELGYQETDPIPPFPNILGVEQLED